jgi:hypothetical protein
LIIYKKNFKPYPCAGLTHPLEHRRLKWENIHGDPVGVRYFTGYTPGPKFKTIYFLVIFRLSEF